MSRASLDKAPRDVATMFDELAPRYDLMNDVLSLGQDRLWRMAVRKAVGARSGDRVLDLAAGTGTSAVAFGKDGAYVVPADFSIGMLAVGRKSHPTLPFVGADALALPFAADSFDAVTISFALRNVRDTELALREMLRVTRPGGRLVICEFSTPTWRPFRFVYSRYLVRALPPVARLLSSNAEGYDYLAESISDWPDQRQLAARIVGAGWGSVGWRNLTGGVVAVHTALAPLA